jgi:hypothetical protein
MKPDTTNMTKEEAAAALTAYYANIPLPAGILNYGKSKKSAGAKYRKQASKYMSRKDRNI